MKAPFALVAALALPLGLSAMPTAVESPASNIVLQQDVKLADGFVLPAGAYDVKIEYRGGNAAELHFYQGGVFKHKNPAEARGFPAHPGVGSQTGGQFPKVVVESSPKLDKSSSSADNANLKQDKYPGNEKPVSAGAPQAFSWEAYGFKGAPGRVVPAGKGQVKLLFDSTNSAAGFSAILPYIEKARK